MEMAFGEIIRFILPLNPSPKKLVFGCGQILVWQNYSFMILCNNHMI